MWKRRDDGVYERPCRRCNGSGKETIEPRYSCGCPWGHSDEVDHPSNSANDPGDEFKGIWHKIVRCDYCFTYWLVYFERGDDSWDVPGPEKLGAEMPAADWRPGK